MKKIITILKFLIGFSILFFLFYKIGFIDIINTFKRLELPFILAAIVLHILIFFLGCFNIKVLLNSIEKRIKFLRLFKYYMISWSFGLFIPGNVGEFSLIYFLKKKDVSIGEGTSIMMIDKVITLMITALIALAGFFIFFPKDVFRLSLFLFAIFVILAFSLTNTGRMLIKRYILRKYAVKFKGFSRVLFHIFKEKKSYLFLNFLLTILRFIVIGLVFLVIFVSLGQSIGLTQIIIINSIGIIISLIPITPAGLGVREAVAVLLYSRIGVPGEVTITVYLFFAILNYLTAAINFLVQKIE